MSKMLSSTLLSIPAIPPISIQSKNPKSISLPITKRSVIIHGLFGVGLATSALFDNAEASARRPPPPPPTEKKDPNMSAAQAKILASKKRKEAMKENVAKLREEGKTITETPTSVTTPPAEKEVEMKE
ncbi:hypothetical protein ZOSMA_27G00050 [Zostera marina]|uniref:Uncharacterized protein n=1 Tax=Zostera marina TaxID=29655 RepID=A0A0K9PFF8_ZOSMR|nr:hypothetical protein ZOSMA_27G00050 [Zostera marina]